MAKQLETILYVEDGATAAGIKNTCEQYNSIKEYAFILHDKDTDEDGNPIKPHFHLYCRFGSTNVSIKEFADWFNVTQNKVEKIKAKRNSPFHVLKYYLHRDYPEKYQYDVGDILGNMANGTPFSRQMRYRLCPSTMMPFHTTSGISHPLARMLSVSIDSSVS